MFSISFRIYAWREQQVLMVETLTPNKMAQYLSTLDI